MAPRAERVFSFSSESVNEGRPDKIYDQVFDASLAIPNARSLVRLA